LRSYSQSDGNGLRLTARKLTVLALMGAVMFASKVALSFIPNVHMGALLIILSSVVFGWEAFYPAIVYILLEGIMYGFSLWWLSYLYIWPLLVLAANLLRKNESVVFWAVVAAAHGLCFGALCAIPYFFIGGAGAALAYWINGIPFDVVHCVSNFAITLVLLKPLRSVISRFALQKTE
jgi:energy-coupling factor transport system substrate-specific component